MPYKNQSDKLVNRKEYLEKNGEEINRKNREKWKNRSEEEIEKQKQKRKDWVNKNREEINIKRQNRKRKHKQYLIEMLGGKCVGCGTTKNLQFDHIDRTKKSFCIGSSLASKLEKLIDEAKKCQLLCESCHRHKTLVNHDCNNIAVGKRVVSIEIVGNKTIVTLEELAQDT
jgi:flagellar biosynthesis GTPase FlhF